MINKSITVNYELEWELDDNPHYKFTKQGICINTKTGRIIKKSLNGYTYGFHINGKFTSIHNLRKKLRRITSVDCPF